MSQGIGSTAVHATLALPGLMNLLVIPHYAQAANYVVGNGNGWTFNVEGWTCGKTSAAGDALTFKYSLSLHNVVVVDAASYQKCVVPSGAKAYDSGNDQITLAKGDYHFICGFRGHCQSWDEDSSF